MRTCVCASISRLTVAPSPLPPRPVARSVSGIKYTVNQSVPTSPTCAPAAHVKGIAISSHLVCLGTLACKGLKHVCYTGTDLSARKSRTNVVLYLNIWLLMNATRYQQAWRIDAAEAKIRITQAMPH